MPDTATDEVLEARLKSKGIGMAPGDFRELVIRAVDNLASVHPMDPTRSLSAGEVDALRRGGFDLTPRDRSVSPLAATAATFAAMIATGFTTGEMAARLGVESSRVRQRATAGSLYGFKVDGQWRFPAFHFAGDDEVPNLGRVLAAIDRAVHPVTVQRWLATACPDLLVDGEAVAPLEWLVSGGAPELVEAIARAL